jgi:hypothetical protein
MKFWTNVAQYATEVLALALIFRLLLLRGGGSRVYRIFVGFLAVQSLGVLAYFVCAKWPLIDYQTVWFFFTALLAIFSLWLAYSLALAVLAELPGILRFSRRLLNIAFPVAVLIAFSTAKSEYWMTPSHSMRPLTDQLIYAFVVAEKGLSMAAVIVLIVILAFILWFPVKMSKNLAVFSIGLVVYFAAKTALKLLTIYSSVNAAPVIDLCVSGILVLCFLYWMVFLTAEGQRAEVRVGHGWRPEEQEKLLGQLEALNGALMRSSQQLRSTTQLPL